MLCGKGHEVGGKREERKMHSRIIHLTQSHFLERWNQTHIEKKYNFLNRLGVL